MEKFLREKLVGGNFADVSASRSKMMQAVKGKGNKTTELVFCHALEQAGLVNWKKHEKIVGNPDICFPGYKIVVFLDGCFWHGCPQCGHIPKTNHAYWKAKIARNQARDIEKEQLLKEQGYFVVRFWEHELLENPHACIAMIKDIIEDRLASLIHDCWDGLLL